MKIYSQSTNDSLRIYLQGILKGESYKIFYNHYEFANLKCYGNFCYYYFAIPIDSLIKKGKEIQLSIYRKGRHSLKYKQTYFYSEYDPTQKYLIIFRNIKLKDKFAIEPLWRDVPLRYLHGSMPAKVKKNSKLSESSR